MRSPFLLLLVLVSYSCDLPCGEVCAQDRSQSAGVSSRDVASHEDEPSPDTLLSHAPQDVVNQLRLTRQRAAQEDSLISTRRLGRFHQEADQAQKQLYDNCGIKTALAFNSVLQGLSDALDQREQFGMATDMDLLVAWDLIDRGQPTHGRMFLGLEGRWDYGPPGPSDLGPASLGSTITTANAFAEYNPVYIVRNLFWKQGSPEAGWAYRIGHITPDQILSTSSQLSPLTTFLSVAGTGSFANALPDSGLGAVAGCSINDRVRVGGLVSDANANRLEFGNEFFSGDYYKALELQAKVLPLTKEGVFSKITFWHNDGTRDGQPLNGSSGREGWGLFVIHEQELSCDGQTVAILRWGKGYKGSAFYEQQAAAAVVQKDPNDLFALEGDSRGLAFNWATVPTTEARDEYDVEAFYLFPLFRNTDLTLLYQSIFKPALTTELDHAAVFSIRVRSSY